MNMSIWEERRFEEQAKEHEVRSPWERDYARLVHSAAFRRLQSKTQVLGLGESDFYRTRLTHSIEVAQIGVGIVRWLKSKHADSLEIIEALPPSALMNSICFAHDIGHPPFGHGGEVALNVCMRDYGGFEGNGQTLRILAKLDKYTESYGMNQTRRMMLGILKYPATYSDTISNEAYGVVPNQLWLCKASEQKPPKCYLDDERDVVDWILQPLTTIERTKFIQTEEKYDKETKARKHDKPIHKGLDTSIMELADDISYSLHDLEDAIALGLVTRTGWNEYCESDEHKNLFTDCGLDASHVGNELFSEASHVRKKCIGGLVHKLITSISVVDTGLSGATTSLLKWNAVMEKAPRKMMDRIGDLVRDKVIKSPNVQQLEFKGQKLVMELFQALASDPERLLPASTLLRYCQADKTRKMRVICDFISGMTDEYATRMYEKIYHPHKGSIFDRL
ncbi:dGTPase [Thalassolituus oleivorans]|jgi:dGTPase|uniref:anti-phage deoxyguanosine triphosphatase n=1 Tax=Thalassolituus oleivorans TaxID=187493 RepID=UPI0009493766|nr:anti-phage deoxyguanosine triphosphatase [Thalassolituus oleivorans]APR65987.1 dGTPase [Thalassolituus oleivorans]